MVYLFALEEPGFEDPGGLLAKVAPLRGRMLDFKGRTRLLGYEQPNI